MVILETKVFTRLITEMMNDDEYRLLQESLIKKPDIGAIIKGSGGLRKARWKLDGKGKSGGVRFIYYWVNADDQILMMYIYQKSKLENLTLEQIAQLRKAIEKWKKDE